MKSLFRVAAALPPWLSVAVWLAVLLSPTGYILWLMILRSSQMPAPPESFVVSLFCLIPLVALLICGTVAWRSKMSVGCRVGWLVLTVLAMLLQIGVLIAIVRAILIAVTGYAQ